MTYLRVLRKVAPLALVAGIFSTCGSSEPSNPGAGGGTGAIGDTGGTGESGGSGATSGSGGTSTLGACTQFVPGADLRSVSWGLTGPDEASFRAFAQAGSVLPGVVTQTVIDVSTACEAIARDLGADPTAAQQLTGVAAASAWCKLAKDTLVAKFSENGEFETSLLLGGTPATCSASIDAAAACMAPCATSGTCVASASNPTCKGGKVTWECGGDCKGAAGSYVSCNGSCGGLCDRDCTVPQGFVDCGGPCDGICALGKDGHGAGNDAQGNCLAYCLGTCTTTVTGGVQCPGVCDGGCNGVCSAVAGVKFTCDGECTGEKSSPRCQGGQLDLSCEAKAACKVSCAASSSAEAHCADASVALAATTAVTLTEKARHKSKSALTSLETNLPKVLLCTQGRGPSFLATLQGAAALGETLGADPSALGPDARSCLPAIAASLKNAAVQFGAVLEAAQGLVAPLSPPKP